MTALAPHRLCARIEALVDPVGDGHDEPPEATFRALAQLDAFIEEVLDPEEGARLEARAEVPRERVVELARRGLAKELAPEDVGGTLAWSRLLRICSRLAAHDVDLALVLGGSVLGGIPLLVEGSASQRAAYFGSIMRGELGGLALSEPDHGSDLLSNECAAVACPEEGGFRLDGTKGPVNNGTLAAFIVVLARTRPEMDPFAHSLFLVARDDPGTIAPSRWTTVGHRNMDLATIRLEGVTVDSERLVGELGSGFHIVRRALSISRSGVAAQALGPIATCLALMVGHAGSRRLYGGDLHALGAVRELLGRTFVRAVVATALTRRAGRSVRLPESDAGWTSAAKYLVPALLEEVVHDAGTLLGARGILDDGRFARIRRAAPVFAIFDGSSQLQLDELWRHCLAWRGVDDERSPASALAKAGERWGPVVDLTLRLPDWAAAHRDGSQTARFALGRALADVYALGALAEAAPSAALEIASRARLAEIAPRLATTALAFGDRPLAHRLLEAAAEPPYEAAHAELLAIALAR